MKVERVEKEERMSVGGCVWDCLKTITNLLLHRIFRGPRFRVLFVFFNCLKGWRELEQEGLAKI